VVICNNANCNGSKACPLVILQKFKKRDCPCLCKGFVPDLVTEKALCLLVLDLLSPVLTKSNANVQDHYFDVVTNIVGLIAAVLGNKFYWWIDPAGAILLAVYTIINWSGTVMENAGTFFTNIVLLEYTKFSNHAGTSLCSFTCWTICTS